VADHLVLGDVLNALKRDFGGFEIIDHWSQGELHHDLVVRLATGDLGGEILVISTNCNGGVKELITLDDVPDQSALWHWRCPALPQFQGTLDDIRGVARTIHWSEPSRLLGDATASN
jgi:hypothetical protein